MKPKIILCLALVLSCGWAVRGDDSTNVDDMADPYGRLVLSGHTLYGTKYFYGGGPADFGCGAVFKVNTDGTGFAILHEFTQVDYTNPTNSDGIYPNAGLVLSGDTLYGTASQGGKTRCGTVFGLKTNGREFTVLHSFNGSDGRWPEAGLVLSGRTLFGTTQYGGLNAGTVFRINTDSTGFATLHAFAAANGPNGTNTDGSCPKSEMVLSGQTLYGTAWSGGDTGHGTVFKLKTNGTGFAVLHSFASGSWKVNSGLPGAHFYNSDGAYPGSPLVLSNNTLCGAAMGGADGRGTQFMVNTDGTDFSARPFSTNTSGTLLVSGFVLPVSDFVRSGDAYYATLPPGLSGPGGIVCKINTNGTGFTILHKFEEKPIPPGMTD